MMGDEVLRAALTAAATAGLTLAAVIIGPLLRSRSSRGADGSAVLRYGMFIVGFGGVCSLVIAVGWVVFLATTRPQDDGWNDGLTCLSIFSVLFGGWMYEVYRRRVVLDEDGITVRGWLGTRTVRWAEVTRITNNGKFVVRDLTGSVGLSHKLDGLEYFLQECRSRLDPELYGKELEKPIERYL
jgi:hypothetical protein